MLKLKLALDDLRVESFVACGRDARAVGTVRANVITPACSDDASCITCFEDTCACPNTSPRPSCMDCSWDDACVSVPPQCD